MLSRKNRYRGGGGGNQWVGGVGSTESSKIATINFSKSVFSDDLDYEYADEDDESDYT